MSNSRTFGISGNFKRGSDKAAARGPAVSTWRNMNVRMDFTKRKSGGLEVQRANVLMAQKARSQEGTRCRGADYLTSALGEGSRVNSGVQLILIFYPDLFYPSD